MIINISKEDYNIEYVQNPNIITTEIKKDRPNFITFDTETDSDLTKKSPHIIKDRPFLGAVCFNHKVYVFDTTKEFLSQLPVWSRMVKRVYAHNATFDMHMVGNVMGDKFPLQVKNWGDSMGLARLSFEAVSTRDGGDKLGLKPISKKYIDKTSDRFEKGVKKWISEKKKQDRKVLKALLHGIEDEGGKWTFKRVEESDELPSYVSEVIDNWKKEYPHPTYKDVDLDIMIPYLAIDVVLTKILVNKALPVIKHKELVKTMNMENDTLPVVYKMERAGIKVNREYLKECNITMANYIDQLYTKLYQLTGEVFSVGQHAVIKKIYTEKLGSKPNSTNKQFLKKQASNGDEAATIISRLRRLKKWKETYIERILEVSEYDGRFYTQLNQFNPVSGRFSGDAQQFPKDPIYTEEGYRIEKESGNKPGDEHILYHPRRAFEGNIYYLDYSQVELRVQAHYTLYFGGDVNLCRAYMPYLCKHYKTGELYDFRSEEGRKRWSELREGYPDPSQFKDGMEEVFKLGWSVWVNPDTGKYWVPTDVHSATTEKALRIMGYDVDNMDEKTFKFWRGKGKQFNFMRNYGGGDKMAAETLDIKLEQAKAMNQGYTDAFPKVVVYQDNVVKAMRQKGYVENLLGRRYYLDNWNKHYKCANYLIQGSCADYLKEKMIEIDNYLVTNNLEDKVRMILCVHDELQFEKLVDEDVGWIIQDIKDIMEDTPKILVPIVAEAEVTKTNWAAKKTLLNIA